VREARATVTVPFTFTGFVTAFAVHLPGPDDQPLLTTQLTGTGFARARFDILPANGGFPAVYFPIALEGKDYHLEYNFFARTRPRTRHAAPRRCRSRRRRCATTTAFIRVEEGGSLEAPFRIGALAVPLLCRPALR
jgi:hypothetical protein